MTTPHNSSEGLHEALVQGHGRRTPLFRWMINNFDYFSSRLTWARQCGNRPNWTVLADYFLTYHGIADSEGKALHREKVRLTWLRVQSARKRLGKPPVPAPAPPPTGGSPVTQEKKVQGPTRDTNTPNDALADMLAEMNKRSGRI